MSDENNTTMSDAEKDKMIAAGVGIWAAGGAHILAGAAITTGGLAAIPLLAGAVFYKIWAVNAFKAAMKE